MVVDLKQYCTNTIPRRPQRRPSGRRLWRRVARLANRVFETLVKWQTRRWERHALRYLDDRMLKDIGINRADVEREARKPFWRR